MSTEHRKSWNTEKKIHCCLSVVPTKQITQIFNVALHATLSTSKVLHRTLLTSCMCWRELINRFRKPHECTAVVLELTIKVQAHNFQTIPYIMMQRTSFSLLRAQFMPNSQVTSDNGLWIICSVVPNLMLILHLLE